MVTFNAGGGTNGEILGPAMEITDPQEAADYFDALVNWMRLNNGKTQEECEEMARSNLGYYAGYYSHETRERVESLFSCAHPVFEHIPTPDEIARKGIELGQRLNKQRQV